MQNSSNTSTFWSRATDDFASYKRNLLRRKKGVADLRAARYCFVSATSLNYFKVHESSTSNSQESASAKRVELVQTLDHLHSFCILAAESSGNPVVWASGGLQAGSQVQLNIQIDDHKACDILTEVDEDGNETTYLALIGKLLAPATGRHRYTLVSLLDVTDFLDAVTLEDMDRERALEGITLLSEDSDRETASICSSVETRLTDLNVPDVWMQVANKNRANPDTPSQRAESSREARSGGSSQTVRDLLEEFTGELICLYKDFFLLARSQVDEGFYEISYISPTLHADGEHPTGYLKHTPAGVIQRLSKSLRSDERFDIKIKWGSSATAKRMYCAPAFGTPSRTWLCMLVDVDTPHLWRRE